jgi:hypothetical protein
MFKDKFKKLWGVEYRENLTDFEISQYEQSYYLQEKLAKRNGARTRSNVDDRMESFKKIFNV